MAHKYDRGESWKTVHGGAPVKCILDVSKSIRYYFDMAMAKNGLTGIQSRILGHIRHAEEEGRDVYQREIEDVFNIKRSSVTSVLQALERKGLIVRVCVKEDGRIKKLVLTDEARRIQACTYQVLDGTEKEIRALFDEEEFEQFLDYMSRIDNKTKELYYKKEEKNA